MRHDLRKKWTFRRSPSFRFCPIHKIENSEICKICLFLQILAVVITQDLTLFRMSFFGTAHGWGGGRKGPPSLKPVTHPTMMKLDTVIPYPKKSKKYMNHVTHPLSSADISIFSDIDCILIHNFYLFQHSLSLYRLL